MTVRGGFSLYDGPSSCTSGHLVLHVVYQTAMNISLENFEGVAWGGRRMLAVPVALGLSMMLVACDGDDQDAAAVGTTEQQAQVETSVDAGQTDDADQARTSQEPVVTDVDPEKFAVNETGKNAWVLEDGKTFCWVMEEGNASPGVGCNAQLNNPPADPTNGQPATKFHLGTDGEAWLSPDIAGFAPFDYQTLGANERVSIRGVTCTAHGGSDITCEAGGTTVEIRDGKTPDLPVIDGMGGN